LGSSNGNISVNRNGFHQNSSPYATTIWANYVPSNQSCYYTSYAPPAAATIHPALQAATSFHNNNNNQQERDLGA
jgi:hypothetical protein